MLITIVNTFVLAGISKIIFIEILTFMRRRMSIRNNTVMTLMAISLLLISNACAGKTYTVGHRQIDTRLTNMLKDNIKNPWPGKNDLKNASGVFSYSLACLHLGENVAEANKLIVDFYSKHPVPQKKGHSRDNYNGYFWQHIMWRLYHNPISHSRLTAHSKKIIEDNMWFWLEKRSKLSEAKQNKWIIHDSENHDAMQKGSHLMTLIALKKSDRYGPKMKLADGGTIGEHVDAWTNFYLDYFNSRAMEGINVEIACQQYAKYTLGVYYNIMDYSDSPTLRKMAKSMIDLYWADTAMDWVACGVRGGAQTRIYKNRAYLWSGTTYSFHELLWGYGWYTSSKLKTVRTYTMIQAVSPYRVPKIISACVLDTNRPGYLYSSRRFGRGGNWSRHRDYTVVFDQGKSCLRRDTFVTSDYAMGSFTVDMNKDYIALIDQNRIMGVMFASSPTERIVVFGKGGKDPEKSFATISGVTRKNCMVVQRDKNASKDGKATQIFVSKNAWNSRKEVGGWLFTQLDGAYCALRAAKGGYKTEIIKAGVHLTIEDLWAPVIVQMGQASDYKSFTAFQSSVKMNHLSYVSGAMSYKSEAGETFTFYPNSKITPKVNGKTVNLNPKNTYQSPYLNMLHGKEVATFTYGNFPDLVMNFKR